MKECTLFSADIRTKQLAATAVAALGMTITYETKLPERYPDHGLLLIATDLGPCSIPTRPGIFLLDHEADVASSSGSLVGTIGDDRRIATKLASQLGAIFQGARLSKLILVTAAAGGLGLTTLVGLMGLASTRANQKTLLVDQSDQLLRILGARSTSIDGRLPPVQPPKVGVLSADVVVTESLLVEARTKFDSVIFGAGDHLVHSANFSHVLHVTANTALAVEQSLVALTNAKSAHIVLRQLSYGCLSLAQVAAFLRSGQIVEWPEDSNIALTADLGELPRAKRAVGWADRIWAELNGDPIDR